MDRGYLRLVVLALLREFCEINRLTPFPGLRKNEDWTHPSHFSVFNPSIFGCWEGVWSFGNLLFCSFSRGVSPEQYLKTESYTLRKYHLFVWSFCRACSLFTLVFTLSLLIVSFLFHLLDPTPRNSPGINNTQQILRGAPPSLFIDRAPKVRLRNNYFIKFYSKPNYLLPQSNQQTNISK